MIFWCLRMMRAVRAEIDLRVEHGAGGVRHLLAHADHHIGVGLARGRAERVDLGPGISTEFLNSSTASLLAMRAGRGVMVVPDRMRGDEAFRKPDDARAVLAGLADQAAGLLRRAFAVEEHGSGLHRRDLHRAVAVTHSTILTLPPFLAQHDGGRKADDGEHAERHRDEGGARASRSGPTARR